MPQAIRSSSVMTGLTTHGVATGLRGGSGGAAGRAVTGGPGCTLAAPPGALRQLARSSSVMTGFTSHGPVLCGCGAGSMRACGFATTGGPGCTLATPPGALRQLARSSSVITGFTSQGLGRGAADGGGATRACGLITSGGPGCTLAAPPGAARQLARSCSDMTGLTMHGPFGFSASAGGGGRALTGAGFGATGATVATAAAGGAARGAATGAGGW